MPRNVSGTYSLYTPGNPVVPSTVITTTWANNTLADLATAMTDSLSRSGNGGMSAALQLASGTIGIPGLSWTAETNSGFYRSAAGDFRYSVSAADVFQISGNGIRAANGSAAFPGIGFLTDIDNGAYLIGVNNWGLAAGGAKVVDIATTGVTVTGLLVSTGQHQAPDGSIGTPSYSWTSDPDTGFRRRGSGDVALVLNGADGPIFSTTQNAFGQAPVYVVDGLVGTPGLAFNSDVDNGMFRIGTNNWGLTAGGTKVLDLAAGVLGVTGAANVAGGRITVAAGTSENVRLQNDGAFLSFYNTAGSTRSGYLQGTPTGIFLANEITGQNTDVSTTGTGKFTYNTIEVGFRGMPLSRTITTSDNTSTTDNGKSVVFTGAAGQTFTIDTDFGVASNIMTVLNGGTGSLSIAETLSGTMTWLNGSGALSTGTRTLAIGGIATIWMVDANNAYIWGVGVT